MEVLACHSLTLLIRFGKQTDMNILELLTFHRHYWGIFHERPSDKRLIQTCYDCGKEREPKVDLRPHGGVKPDVKLEQRKPKAA